MWLRESRNFKDFKVHSHLQFSRCELLRELFSPRNRKKWLHNPFLNYSIAHVNAWSSHSKWQMWMPQYTTMQAIKFYANRTGNSARSNWQVWMNP